MVKPWPGKLICILIFGAVVSEAAFLNTSVVIFLQVLLAAIFLLICCLFDVTDCMIPDLVCYIFAIAFFVLLRIIADWQVAVSQLLKALIILSALTFVSKLSKEKFGMGDALMLSTLSIILGTIPLIFCLCVALILSGGVSAFKSVKCRKTSQTLPFAPFLLFSMLPAVCLM